MLTLASILLAVWLAWRYSRIEVDPDWAMFNLAAFTGAWYGRDFLDCKTPAIHLWYYGIARLVGADVQRVRFTHHLLVSIPGVLVGGWAGLAFVMLVNSGWLLAFHGNVGQQAAGFILLALSVDSYWLGGLCVGLAVLFEPKLLPSGALIFLLNGWYAPAAVYTAIAGVILLALRARRRQWWGWLIEANLTITSRMAAMRRVLMHQVDLTYTAGRGLMYLLPWLCTALLAQPDWRYWLPAAVYAGFIAIGLVVRDNHYLPLAAWVALALPVEAVLLLLVADMVSGFGYLGDIWRRYYPGLTECNKEAQAAGEWLRDKEGRVWVNSLHSGVYIHARKPPLFGLAEQIEIRENTPERRAVWRDGFRANPPEWVVVGYSPGWKFSGQGYRLAHTAGMFEIFRRL